MKQSARNPKNEQNFYYTTPTRVIKSTPDYYYCQLVQNALREDPYPMHIAPALRWLQRKSRSWKFDAHRSHHGASARRCGPCKTALPRLQCSGLVCRPVVNVCPSMVKKRWVTPPPPPPSPPLPPLRQHSCFAHTNFPHSVPPLRTASSPKSTTP
jgi:hypothetical protein